MGNFLEKLFFIQTAKDQLEQELINCKGNILQMTNLNEGLMSEIATVKAEHEQQLQTLRVEYDHQTQQLNQKKSR